MDIPENERMTWVEAMRMACAETGIQYRIGDHYASDMEAFARYIQRTEPRPVDPVLVEVRKIVAEVYEEQNCPHSANSFRAGEWDFGPEMKSALACFRRGMEWK